MENSLPVNLSGSCLCGAVVYQLTKQPSEFYFCHCRQCQKVTGSGFAANMLSNIDSIEWTKGGEYLTHYEHSSRAFSKTFCSLCGSGLPHINKGKTHLVIPAGSLDEPPAVSPNANLFSTETARWLDHGLAAKKFSAFPNEDLSDE